jgi:gamma-glutamyl-gamma-aminobutyrate hydrolase PuuD
MDEQRRHAGVRRGDVRRGDVSRGDVSRSDVPVIGVTAGSTESEIESLKFGNYLAAVRRAGGEPRVVQPPAGAVLGEVAEWAAELAGRIDGLLLTGGVDVDPARYGAGRQVETQPPESDRDAAELALTEAAGERDVPVLAICRGMQILNVSRGGTLVQHLPGHLIGHHLSDGDGDMLHEVSIAEGTRLAGILGHTRATIPSRHHQAVEGLGRGLLASAWAGDGVLEGVEDPQAPFLVGVQWHPERGHDLSLFDALVTASQASPDPAGRERESQSMVKGSVADR